MYKNYSNFLFVDIEGCDLTAEDIKVLEHPYVAGVILFTRNYNDSIDGLERLKKLIKDIKSIKNKNLKISVDHEGGDVQRFKSNFTLLPRSSDVAEIYNQNNEKGLNLAYSIGKTAGTELSNIGIDINYAPSVDLKGMESKIVSTRSYGSDSNTVIRLAKEYIKGLNSADVTAVIKHFPSHGFVEQDSHFDLPIDNRKFIEIEKNDLKIYKEIFKYINTDKLSLMTAHIIYSEVDKIYPASLSKILVTDLLKNQLGFDGMVFSDDLNMKALDTFGSPAEKVKLALDAGCDYILYCNNRKAVLDILDNL